MASFYTLPPNIAEKLDAVAKNHNLSPNELLFRFVAEKLVSLKVPVPRLTSGGVSRALQHFKDTPQTVSAVASAMSSTYVSVSYLLPVLLGKGLLSRGPEVRSGSRFAKTYLLTELGAHEKQLILDEYTGRMRDAAISFLMSDLKHTYESAVSSLGQYDALCDLENVSPDYSPESLTKNVGAGDV